MLKVISYTMPKRKPEIPKRITTFNLDESLVHDFDEICKSEQRSRSNMANKLFKEFMEEVKK